MVRRVAHSVDEAGAHPRPGPVDGAEGAVEAPGGQDGQANQALSVALSTPVPLTAAHLTADFYCGEPSLDDSLKRRALANHLSGASRSFVVADDGLQVGGHYALAAGAVSHEMATPRVRRDMPDPVPVMVLARLAVERRFHSQHLGAALLQDAVQRVRAVANQAGVRALLVHALHQRAKSFYEHHGFQASPTHSPMLLLRLGAAKG